MSCEHEVRFTIKPTDDACRFHFDVRAYKDRIVAPDEYTGATTVTPSSETQVLETKDKLVRDDITVNPAPTEILSTDHNGTFTPSSGKVGFSAVTVDVNPDLRPLSVSENGEYQPDGFDGYSQVNVGVLSIMDNLLEVVSSVTPEQDAQTLEFPCDKKTGMYFIVSNPPGTRAFAAQQSWSQTINATVFEIRGSAEGGVWTQGIETMCFRRKTESGHEVDWWSVGTSKTENGVRISPTSERYPFLAGVTYYLLRVKGA